MTTFYLAETDDNGVFCVQPVHDESQTPEHVARLARDFPEVIYFAVEPEVKPTIREVLVKRRDSALLVLGALKYFGVSPI